jgi:hypothetical protein
MPPAVSRCAGVAGRDHALEHPGAARTARATYLPIGR